MEHELWKSLACRYELHPRPGIIQLLGGQVCMIPKELIVKPICIYKEGNWIEQTLENDLYVYFHNTTKFPIPQERISDLEYILFVLDDYNISPVNEYGDEYFNSIHVTDYGLVRYG